MAKEQQFNYITYGSKADAEKVVNLLDHFSNLFLTANTSDRPTPVCIWGMHGIGKTELVRDYANSKGFQFIYIAPAQFEEMGDLLGMPKIEQQKDSSTTKFIAPDWVPQQNGPGIFLID